MYKCVAKKKYRQLLYGKRFDSYPRYDVVCEFGKKWLGQSYGVYCLVLHYCNTTVYMKELGKGVLTFGHYLPIELFDIEEI